MILRLLGIQKQQTIVVVLDVQEPADAEKKDKETTILRV